MPEMHIALRILSKVVDQAVMERGGLFIFIFTEKKKRKEAAVRILLYCIYKKTPLFDSLENYNMACRFGTIGAPIVYNPGADSYVYPRGDVPIDLESICWKLEATSHKIEHRLTCCTL